MRTNRRSRILSGTTVIGTAIGVSLILASRAASCQHEPVSTLTLQSADKKYEAVLESKPAHITVASRPQQTHQWERTLAKGEACSQSVFGQAYLIDNGNTLILICNNYDAHRESDPGVIVVRATGVVVYPVGQFVSRLVSVAPALTQSDDIPHQEFLWLSAVGRVDEETVVLRTAEDQEVVLFLSDGSVQRASV